MKIIKKIGAIVIFMIISYGSSAQVFNYGVHAGINCAMQSGIGDIYDNDDIRTAYTFGLQSTYSINPKLFAQVELNYDQKGSKSDVLSDHYDYISVPILVSYIIHKGDKTPWLIAMQLGPHTSFLIHAEREFNNNEKENIDLFNQSSSMDFGAMGGFMLKYPIQNNSLLLAMNYTLGLVEYNHVASDSRNKTLTFSVGYQF